MSRSRDVMVAYRSTTLAVMQVFAFAISGVGVAFALAAAVDLAFDFRWAYGWAAIGGGIVFTLAGIGAVWLVRQIQRALDHFSQS
jgi:hypothetical protein